MGLDDASASTSAIFLCTLDSSSATSLRLALEAKPLWRYVHMSSEHLRAAVSNITTPPPPVITMLVRSSVVFFPR